ncbi:short-chain dehydrogenase TIC 32, chloroplastic-like protein [Tanacetum coccineum]
MAPPFMLSKDNIELQFATNHLGHFLLTQLLVETMKRTSHEQNIEGRIVNVSSEGHRFAYKGIYFDQLNNESSYNSIYAYVWKSVKECGNYVGWKLAKVEFEWFVIQQGVDVEVFNDNGLLGDNSCMGPTLRQLKLKLQWNEAYRRPSSLVDAASPEIGK